MTYRIMPPGEDWNSPNYERWSICANDLQIVNDMSTREEAQACLLLIYQIDQEQILSAVLKKFGLSLSQSPFSYSVLKAAFDHFKS